MSSALQVMVDIESMGTKPGSAVVAIGAVAFDFQPEYREVNRFHDRISLESCVRYGLRIDASTVKWWLTQSDVARAETQAPDDEQSDLRQVLGRFRDWVIGLRKVQRNLVFYGNSAAFDLGLLGTGFDVVKLARPWKYWEEACYRTLKNARRDVLPFAFEGVQHNALADAEHQARHCAELLRAVGAVFEQPKEQVSG